VPSVLLSAVECVHDGSNIQLVHIASIITVRGLVCRVLRAQCQPSRAAPLTCHWKRSAALMLWEAPRRSVTLSQASERWLRLQRWTPTASLPASMHSQLFAPPAKRQPMLACTYGTPDAVQAASRSNLALDLAAKSRQAQRGTRATVPQAVSAWRAACC
jgi:hypothetical protein